MLIPGSTTGSSVLTVPCCKGFAWKEPSKESFDGAAAVPWLSSEKTSAAESPVRVLVEFRPSHALPLPQVWLMSFFHSWRWFERVESSAGLGLLLFLQCKTFHLFFLNQNIFRVILVVLSGVTQIKPHSCSQELSMHL